MKNERRHILHCDMNSFYASVELLDHPDLLEKPVAVCGNPADRHGIILAKNDPAKKYGITTGESLFSAFRKCPDLVTLSPHREKYRQYSRKINEIYLRYTDMVEPFSIDESWLDVTGSTGLFGNSTEIADMIRETVKKELGLTLSAGVSFNKFLAKMGSDYKKPDATTVITEENFRDMIWPMKIENMFFVGRRTADKLKKTGIFTIGDLALSDVNVIENLLGKTGILIHECANGKDDRPVHHFTFRKPPSSVGNSLTFTRDLTSAEEIKTALTGLSDKVTARLRHNHLKAGGIRIELKDSSFSTYSRQKQFSYPTFLEHDFVQEGMDLAMQIWYEGLPVRLISVTAINLCQEDTEEQLSFFSSIPHEKRQSLENLDRTIDRIRERFGDSSIEYGNIFSSSIGFRKK